VIYHYLNDYFPNDYKVQVDIIDEVKMYMERVKPFLPQIADIHLDNSKRL
jgi:hypothetical protein